LLDTFGKGDDSRRLNSSRLDYTAGVGLCKVGVWGRRLRRRPPHWVCPNFVGLGRRPFRLAVNGQAQARMRRYCNLTNYSDNPLPCPWAGVPGPQPSPHPCPLPSPARLRRRARGGGGKRGFAAGGEAARRKTLSSIPPLPRPQGQGERGDKGWVRGLKHLFGYCRNNLLKRKSASLCLATRIPERLEGASSALHNLSQAVYGLACWAPTILGPPPPSGQLTSSIMDVYLWTSSGRRRDTQRRNPQ